MRMLLVAGTEVVVGMAVDGGVGVVGVVVAASNPSCQLYSKCSSRSLIEFSDIKPHS